VLNAIPATAGAVIDSYINSGAVTTAKIADANVTQAKLAAGVAGNGPAFSAYKSSNQSITSNTFTKVTFDTEEFDTNSNFASSTFTPTVAGYYQVNAAVDLYPSSGTATRTVIRLYKNANNFKTGNEVQISNTTEMSCVVSALISMNGTTDYLEIYALQTGTTPNILGSQSTTYFQACLVRGA
jgi:hypothetical protein